MLVLSALACQNDLRGASAGQPDPTATMQQAVPTAASAPTAEPQPTDEPAEEVVVYPDLSSCGVQVMSGPYVSKYQKNTDDGSPHAITLWLAGSGFVTPGNWVMSILPPMASLDLEAEEITSYGWKVLGTMKQAECAANAILDFYDVSAYLYSPNTADLSGTWSNDLPGWAAYVWLYEEEPISPGGDWSQDMTLDLDTHEVCAPDDGWANAQLWNPNVAKDAYHPVIQGGWCLSTPKVQGTWWTVTGDFNFDLLVERWNQTVREVDLRDHHPPVHPFFCGNTADVPVGYSTEMPVGWSCQKER